MKTIKRNHPMASTKTMSPTRKAYVRCVGCEANSGEIIHGLCGDCRAHLTVHYELTTNPAMPPRKPKPVHRLAAMRR